MLGVHFKNGVVLPIYHTESIFVPETTIEQFGLANAVLSVGKQGTAGMGFAMPKRNFSIVDENDNTWTFEIMAGPKMHLSIADKNNVIFKSIYWNSNYDPTQGWVTFLIYNSETDDDVTFSLWQARSTLYRSQNVPYMFGGYIDGENGMYSYADDIGIIGDDRYRRVQMTNFITSDSTDKYFADIVGIYERPSDGSVSDEQYYLGYLHSGSGLDHTEITLPKTVVKPIFEDTDPYEEVDGETDLTGDTIPIPNLPPESATSTGIIGLFAPSHQQMRDLADFMWTDFGGTASTTIQVLQELVEAVKRSISNPLDYVLGLNLIPSQGLSIGATQTIRFGFVSSNVSMPRLADQYFTVDCGSLSFGALCGDTFLDYAPYAKFSIYLPYIGFKEVDANDFVGHTIGVVYHGDVVTGGVTAYITKDGSVMYQYSGCCALTIPLSADSWGETISAATQVAVGLIGAAAAAPAGTASVTGKGLGSAGLATLKSTASAVAANPSLLSPRVMHSGAVSGSPGAMGIQTPFIVREAVRFHSTERFNTISGYPSYYYRKLSNVHGYTTVVDVHLSNVPATKTEVERLEELLRGGVIL